jgi:hypothetical protein
MIKWFKSLFGKKKTPEPEKVVVEFQLPDKKIKVEAIRILEYQPQLHCKLHQNYSGATVPINNCNVCWEIYSQKCKR